MPTPRQRFSAALLPKFSQEPDEEALLRNYLETGSTEFVPQAPTDSWTPEEFQIASMTGDPMGVRQVFDQINQQNDEQEFIKTISEIDWTQPRVANQVSQLIGQNPRAATPENLNWMKFFGQLGGGEDDAQFLDKAAGYGSEALKTAQDVYDRTGDRRAALAAVADLRAQTEMKAPTASEGARLGTYSNDFETARKSAEAFVDEDGQDQDAKDKAEAYKRQFGKEPKTSEEWQTAYWLRRQATIGEDYAKLKSYAEALKKSNKEVDPAVLEILAEEETKNPLLRKTVEEPMGDYVVETPEGVVPVEAPKRKIVIGKPVKKE